MGAQQIGGREADETRGELREARVESERAAGPDDRRRHRQPDECRADEQQLLPVPFAAAARRGAVGKDEAARYQPVDEDANAKAERSEQRRRGEEVVSKFRSTGSQ